MLREQSIGGGVFAISFRHTERGHRINGAESRIDDDERDWGENYNDHDNGENPVTGALTGTAGFARWVGFLLRLIAPKHRRQRLLRLLLFIHPVASLHFSSGSLCPHRYSLSAVWSD